MAAEIRSARPAAPTRNDRQIKGDIRAWRPGAVTILFRAAARAQIDAFSSFLDDVSEAYVIAAMGFARRLRREAPRISNGFNMNNALTCRL